MTKKTLRIKTRKLAKELYYELLTHINKSVECVECDGIDPTEWGQCYAIINAFLQKKRYPVNRVGSNRLIKQIINQAK